RHLIDTAVAGGAAHAFLDVDAVVEVDEVGEVVDADPGERLVVRVVFVALSDLVGQRAAGPDLVVAVDAGGGGRDTGGTGPIGRGVAVAAVDAQAGDVMLMAEGHGLLAGDADAGGVGGADVAGVGPAGAGDDEDGAENGDLGDRVKTAVKNLRH